MKTIIILILSLFITCNKKTNLTEKSNLKFFYITSVAGKEDTLNKTVMKPTSKDDLISGQNFEYRGKTHRIQMYLTDYDTAKDWEQLIYELDSLGIIYSRVSTQPMYYRLHCNDDSLNSLFDAALENIILYPTMRCYNCGSVSFEKVKVVPPKPK